MDLSNAPDEARFRQDLRTWLEKSLPELPWPEPAYLVEKAPFWRQWQSTLFEAGYAGLTCPCEYGGQGLDERMRAIFGEECDLAGAPERLNTIGEDFAGPTIVHFGSEAQKQRFLRPILTGEEIWCQLFSEPESGSDLASLRTRATKVADGWGRRRAGEKHLGGGGGGIFVEEMMLDLPRVVVAEPVGEHHLRERVLEQAVLVAFVPRLRQLQFREHAEAHGLFSAIERRRI